MKNNTEQKSKIFLIDEEIPKLFFRNKTYPVHSCILMKVGSHGAESFTEILNRKKSEHISYGFMLWGYSGNLLNVIDTRKHFESKTKLGNKFFIFMIETKSPFKNSPVRSKYFSLDKMRWFALPQNLFTTGCDKAIICRNLTKSNFQFDLSKYSVASGASKGKNASEYLKFRTDKACIELSGHTDNSDPSFITVSWVAEILPPYAIHMKKDETFQQNLFSDKIPKSKLGVFGRLQTDE
ncbi:MAG: hypothetical protein NTX65_05180 [Ignavibacteriales bacterium]|nr:hypothetical protein [Ignavibacteriales bacterium]